MSMSSAVGFFITDLSLEFRSPGPKFWGERRGGGGGGGEWSENGIIALNRIQDFRSSGPKFSEKIVCVWNKLKLSLPELLLIICSWNIIYS